MSLLARRRVMMQAIRHPNDGKYCYAIGTDGVLYGSSNYGATFYSLTTAPGTVARLAMASSPTASVVLTNNKGNTLIGIATPAGTNFFNKSSMGGTAHSLCVSTGSSCYHHFAINSGTDWSTGYIATIKRFTGDPASETSVTTQGTMNTWDQAANSASACSLDGKYAVIGGMTGYTNAFYTNNFGNSWAECLATQSYGNGVRDVAMSGDGAYTIACTETTWVQSNNYLATWAIGSNGSSWRSCAVSGDGRWRFICSSPSNPRLFRGTITDFENIYTDTAFVRIRCNYYGNRLIAIATNGSIYYSSNGGYNWTQSTTSTSGGATTFVEIAMNRDPK